MKEYYVYILRCSDGLYYTGITNNVEKRVEEHKQGTFEECYTHKRRPLECVYAQVFGDVNNAIASEKQIKGWSRAKKEALIKGDFEELKRLSRKHGSTSSP